MNVAASPGASIGASTQEYPDSKPAEVPPRLASTGADPRVRQSRGAYAHMSLTEIPEEAH